MDDELHSFLDHIYHVANDLRGWRLTKAYRKATKQKSLILEDALASFKADKLSAVELLDIFETFKSEFD